MGITARPWMPKHRSIMTKLDNQIKKEQEARKNFKAKKKEK